MNAGGFQMLGHPIDTEIAFMHGLTGHKAGCAKRADHGTGPATDASIFIHPDHPGGFVSENRLPWTDKHTGGVIAMKTGEGDKGQPRRRVLPLFQFEQLSVRHALSGDIILVHTGHDTGHASTAARKVKRKCKL